MTAHARTQLRNTVKAVLTGLPRTDDRVFVGRVRPLPKAYDPTLRLSMPQETLRRDANGNPPKLARVVTLHVEICTCTAEPPDDLHDEIAADVETALWESQALHALLQNIQFTDVQQVVKADGERHIGGMQLEYKLTYRTPEGVPRTIIP